MEVVEVFEGHDETFSLQKGFLFKKEEEEELEGRGETMEGEDHGQ